MAFSILAPTSKPVESAGGQRDAGGEQEANLSLELTELGGRRKASVQTLTAGVLPTDEVLVGLQEPPDF